DWTLGYGELEARVEAASAEPRSTRHAGKDVGLDSKGQRNGGLAHIDWRSTDSIDPRVVTGVALEQEVKVGNAGIASRHGVDDASLGGRNCDPPVVGGGDHGKSLGCD